MRMAQDRSIWRTLEEAWDQQWMSFGWHDNDNDTDLYLFAMFWNQRWCVSHLSISRMLSQLPASTLRPLWQVTIYACVTVKYCVLVSWLNGILFNLFRSKLFRNWTSCWSKRPHNKFRWCHETNQLLRNTIIKQRSLPTPVSRHQASNRVGRHNTNAPANAPGYCQSRALLIDDAIEQTSTDHALV